MYDDGAHNDGAAGDLLYGSPALTMNAASIQCYVYAENADAGIFFCWWAWILYARGKHSVSERRWK